MAAVDKTARGIQWRVCRTERVATAAEHTPRSFVNLHIDWSDEKF
jgi:hypothetical protein